MQKRLRSSCVCAVCFTRFEYFFTTKTIDTLHVARCTLAIRQGYKLQIVSVKQDGQSTWKVGKQLTRYTVRLPSRLGRQNRVNPNVQVDKLKVSLVVRPNRSSIVVIVVFAVMVVKVSILVLDPQRSFCIQWAAIDVRQAFLELFMRTNVDEIATQGIIDCLLVRLKLGHLTMGSQEARRVPVVKRRAWFDKVMDNQLRPA